MLTVAELMTSDVLTIDADDTLAKAAFELDAELASGAPVSDATGVVGMVSKTDLLEADKPLPMMRVRQVMKPYVYSVHRDDPVTLAAKIMAAKGIHRLVVEGAPGEPIGIITAMDVVRAIARGARFD